MVGNSLVYTVKPGETIWSIADKFKVNPGEMISVNALEGLNVVYNGQSLVIPGYEGKYQREILGYYPVNQNNGKPPELNPLLTSISPCWGEVNGNGSLTTKIDTGIVEKARKMGIKIYTRIQNFGFDGSIADSVLEKTQVRQQLIRNIMELVEENRLSGINLHLKNVATHNRDYLNKLVQVLAHSLRQEGSSLLVTLPAKTGDSTNSYWGSYDYQTIGEYADQVVLEVYDFHWSEGHPGPITPLYWIRDVLDYAVLTMAEEKIILGIPCYGYDWRIPDRQKAQLLSYQKVMELKERYKCLQLWDVDAKVPYFNYYTGGEDHQVWFENLESFLAKFDLVKKYHLGGIALRSLGHEDPQIWSALAKLSSFE